MKRFDFSRRVRVRRQRERHQQLSQRHRTLIGDLLQTIASPVGEGLDNFAHQTRMLHL
jgi:hypothetical protein